MCGVRCELKDKKTRIHNVHPDLSSFSTEIGELKDERARVHNVHPGSQPLNSSQLAEMASWLNRVSSGQAGVSSRLAGVSCWLAGDSS